MGREKPKHGIRPRRRENPDGAKHAIQSEENNSPGLSSVEQRRPGPSIELSIETPIVSQSDALEIPMDRQSSMLCEVGSQSDAGSCVEEVDSSISESVY
mmetsp:Transcript_19697/g.26699  ORF Transcript_19697/g.26699 Transcript_19697/m.26699 type:complete len:99 (-) Transcript_19697:50-346(-)